MDDNIRRPSSSYLELSRGVSVAANSAVEAKWAPKYADALNNSEDSPTSEMMVRGGSALRLCRDSVCRSAEVQMVAIRSSLDIQKQIQYEIAGKAAGSGEQTGRAEEVVLSCRRSLEISSSSTMNPMGWENVSVPVLMLSIVSQPLALIAFGQNRHASTF